MNEEYGCCCTPKRGRRRGWTALHPCLTMPAPDVIVYDVAGTTPVGGAYSVANPCFSLPIEDLAGNVTHYAASEPPLSRPYVARTDLSGNVTHYLLAI